MALARLEIKRSDIPNQYLDLILCNEKAISLLNYQGVANNIWSLGTIGVSIDEMSINIKEMLINKLCETTHEMTDQAIANVLIGLQKMTVNWTDLPPLGKSAISNAICRCSADMSAQSLGNILYSLGRMKTRISDLTTRLQLALDLAIHRTSRHLKDRDVTQIVQGLSLLGYSTIDQSGLIDAIYSHALTWRYLPNNIKWNDDHVIGDLARHHSQDISTNIQSFCSIYQSLDQMPAPVRASVFLGMQIISGQHEYLERQKTKQSLEERDLYGAFRRSYKPSTNNRDNTNVRNSSEVILREMMEYFNISNEITINPNDSITNKSITNNKISKSNNYASVDLTDLATSFAISFQSLSIVHRNINSLPVDVRESIWISLCVYSTSFNSIALAKTLLAMNNLGIQWKHDDYLNHEEVTAFRSLSLAVYRRLLDSISSNETFDLRSYSNMLYALGSMGLTWNSLSTSLQNVIFQGISRSIPATESLIEFKYLATALTTLRVHRESLSIELRTQLVDKLLSLTDSLSILNYSKDSSIENDIYSVVPISLRLYAFLNVNLTSNQINALSRLIRITAEGSSIQGLSTILLALTEMRVYELIDRYYDIKIMYLSIIESTVYLIQSNEVDLQSLSTCIYSMAKSNLMTVIVKDDSIGLTSVLRGSLINSLSRADDINSIDLSMLFVSLPELFDSFSAINEDLQIKLLDLLTNRLTTEMPASVALAILKSLRDLKFVFDLTIHQSIYQRLVSYIYDIFENISQQEMVTLIIHLTSLKLIDDRLFSKLLESVITSDIKQDIVIDTSIEFEESKSICHNDIKPDIKSYSYFDDEDDNRPPTRIPITKRVIRSDYRYSDSLINNKLSINSNVDTSVSIITIIKLLDCTKTKYKSLSPLVQRSITNRLQVFLDNESSRLTFSEALELLTHLVGVDLVDIDNERLKRSLGRLVERFVQLKEFCNYKDSENFLDKSLDSNLNAVDLILLSHKLSINLFEETMRLLVDEAFKTSKYLLIKEDLILLNQLMFMLISLDKAIDKYITSETKRNFMELSERVISRLSMRSNHPTNSQYNDSINSRINFYQRLVKGYHVTQFYRRFRESFDVSKSMIGQIDVLLAFVILKLRWKDLSLSMRSLVMSNVQNYLRSFQYSDKSDVELLLIVKSLKMSRINSSSGKTK
eukprot:gene19628-25538_t